jgi:hypothetical protein
MRLWLLLCYYGGICGKVIEVVDTKALAPRHWGFYSHHGFWILSCEEAIQLVYRTSMVLVWCLFMPEIYGCTCSLPQTIKLECRYMNSTVLLQHKKREKNSYVIIPLMIYLLYSLLWHQRVTIPNGNITFRLTDIT